MKLNNFTFNCGIFKCLAIGLASLWLTLFVFFPSVLVMITSFLTRDPQNTVALPVNIANYQKAFDPLYLQVFLDSLTMSVLATICCLLIAYPFALAISKLDKRLQAIALFLMIVPFWTNSLVRTYAIQFILGKQGLINKALLALDAIDKPLQLMYTQGAVIIGLCYILLPFMVLPLFSSLEKLDSKLQLAAQDLGANAWQRFWHITIPLTMPGIVAGCLMVLLPSMGMYYIADLLGGAKNLLLGNVIKTQFLNTRDWPFGSAFSVLLMLLLAFMLWLYFRAAKFANKQGGLGDANF
ncbi:spermidine/putrescine ABC transporter membrane protein [Catenovulum agarivorans DS-2]|uniref:Spermidine/putrescine ABC transporter membrane protein n=1 Tax=Catenovulum agarivorans DS-2 TaxID=1328313 RepID=W7QIH4_9ALTE|nr:spermidine/putrescine ABC transporter permease PotB [Catenovulum agarivorans]EWH08727.1 spermidine/putrescine ABC transporter membrane protein [Catenovulum agarivorans DS-2]